MRRYMLTIMALTLLSPFSTLIWAQEALPAASAPVVQEQPQSDSPSDEEMPTTADDLRASTLENLGAWRHKEAKKELEATRETLGNTTEFKTAWGYLLAQEKKLDKAIEELSQAAEKFKADPAAPYFLGEIHAWKLEKSAASDAWKDAKNRAEKILKSTPADGEANYWMGATLLKLGKISQAGEYLQKAEKAGYSPALTDLQFGLYYAAQKKWKEAKQAFDQCLKADPGFAHAYYYRARVLDKLGKKSEMLIDLDRFVKLAPDAREAAAARAILNSGS